MSNDKDISVSVTGVPNFSVQIGNKPVYLIRLDSKDKKAHEYFIATKYVESGLYISCAGFFTTSKYEDIRKNFKTEVEAKLKTKDLFIDVKFPWNRIHDVTNLIYVHK